jgi:isoleucyl-tRNA synthetase
LTVGPKIEYVLVQTWNQYTHEPIQVILAKNLVSKQFGKKFQAAEDATTMSYAKGDKKVPYAIIGECVGADLVGIHYEQLLDYVQPYENADQAFRVIPGDFVTTEDGTGIVHTAPTFGADDAFVAKAAGVPGMLILDENENPVPLVDLQGKFRIELNDPVFGLGGEYVKAEY